MEIKWRQISLMTVCGPGKRHLWWVKRLIGWDGRSDWSRRLNFRSSVFILGLVLNHKLSSGLVPCICWPGLLLICFWLAFIADILESHLSSSRSILLTVASCLSGASWMCTVQSMDHWSIFLFLLSFNSIQRSEMSSGHPWGWGWISRSWDEDSRYLKS